MGCLSSQVMSHDPDFPVPLAFDVGVPHGGVFLAIQQPEA
jgi:hypothetical protein